MTVDAELLIARGLFPENLPPVFTAKNIWPSLAPLGTTYAVTNKIVGDPAIYDASKRGNQRRVFRVPHPLFLRDQALFFRRHWNELDLVFALSPRSASKPIIDGAGPRHIRITPHHELPSLRLSRLSRFRYCLVVDISRFFSSIYTHSIRWALHGKAAAKADTNTNSAAVFGSKLDSISRQLQLKQTIGIPIGPDSSKIISELIASKIDEHFLAASSGNPSYLRHVDDYWIGGHTAEECEKHLQNLRSALRSFEMEPNETKTKIISTKYIFGDTWPSELTNELANSLRESNSGTSDIVAVLGKIIDRATTDNDDGIIRHALRAIDRKKLWDSHWTVLEHFLAQCAVQFPHSIDYVARVVAWRRRRRVNVQLPLWMDVARAAAREGAVLGRDSEVAWSFWLLKELNGKIPKRTSDSVLENNGSLVLALLAHCYAHGLTNDKALVPILRSIVTADVASGSQWPLSLELMHLGLGDPGWSGLISGPAGLLHQAGISIIDWAARPRVFDDEDEDTEPDRAIEDFAADYGDDDEADDDEDDFGVLGSLM